jgi:type VI secretion system protein ImpK
MTVDDPFAEPDDSERTIIRPTPGGRRAAEMVAPAESAVPAAPVPPPSPAVVAPPRKIALAPLAHLNPLVNAALPLLDLVVQIKNRAVHNDVASLRDRVVAEMNAFERAITPLGLSLQTMRAARYALCATIDDVVLNTPWGSRSVWTQRSMVGTFHNEVVGGDRFWELLNELKRNAGVNLDLLELLYFCITLGFEGKYRVMPRGASELIMVREDLYRLIRNNRGDFERSLSPRWEGVKAAHRALYEIIPLWLVALVAAGTLALLYVGFTLVLNSRSDVAYEALNALPPAGQVALARAVPVVPPPRVIIEAPKIGKFLEPEIKQGLVTVTENLQTILVRITGRGMFASGSAEVTPSFVPLLQRIGDAINSESDLGAVAAVGHTDNQPIRSVKFPSNFQLSLARAQATVALLKERIKDPARLSAEGRADSEPLPGVSNATPEGREKNRRIEIVISKPQ